MAANPLSYVPFLSGQQNANLMQAQQQQALAQALLSEGTQPVSTEGRSIGGVGYAVSPMEGMAKIGQILAGNIGQNSANDKLAAALSGIGDQTSGTSQGSPMDTAIGKMPPDLQQLVRMWSMPESMGGNPRAAAELIGKFSGPTEQQKNFGTSLPAWITKETMLPGQSAFDTALGTSAAGMQPPGTMPGGAPSNVGGGMPAPQIPVQGPQDLGPLPQNKPIDPNSMPMPKPAVPPPGAGAFNSTLTGSQGEGAANVPLDQLAMPRSALAMPQANGVGTPPPDPRNYPSMNAYQGAMKAWEEGQKAQAQVKPAGEKAQAEEAGKNTAENAQQYNSALSNFGAVQQRIAEMHKAADKSSFNAFNTADGAGPQTFYHRAMGDPTSVANMTLEQLKEQGLMSQIGPQLSATGAKGNRLLEGIITGSDSIDLSSGKPAIHSQIDGLYKNYIKNMIAENQKVKLSGGKPAPMPPVLMKTPKGVGTVDPTHVEDVLNAGGSFVYP